MMNAMVLSGACCGIAGAVLVFGSISHRMVTDGSLTGFTGNDGFNGIVVALFGGLNPLWSILSAYLFGGLLVGGTAMQAVIGVPTDLVTTIEGLVVIFVVSIDYLRFRGRRPFSCAQANDGRRSRLDLHLPQDPRGACHIGPHHGAARGRKIGTVRPSEVTHEQLAEMMVGRQINAESPAPVARTGEVRLAVRDLVVRGDRGNESVREVSLDVRAGEIVGIAGVSGNGQRELGEAIACLRPHSRGSVKVDGVELAGKKASMARRAGLGYVPEERMRDGVIGDFSVAENLMLVDSDKPAFARLGFLRRRAIRAPRPGARGDVRRTHARDRHAYTEPFGRQHSKAHPRPRAFRPTKGPPGGAAHPGHRCGRRPLYS